VLEAGPATQQQSTQQQGLAGASHCLLMLSVLLAIFLVKKIVYKINDSAAVYRITAS